MQMVSPSIFSTTQADFLSQITLAMTVPFSMACSTTTLSQQVAPWVLLFHGLLLFRSYVAEGAAHLGRDKCDIAINW